jgi:hypothetical protein
MKEKKYSLLFLYVVIQSFYIFIIPSKSYATNHFFTSMKINNVVEAAGVVTMSINVVINNTSSENAQGVIFHLCEPVSHEFHYGNINVGDMQASGQVTLQLSVDVPSNVYRIYDKKAKIYFGIDYIDAGGTTENEMYDQAIYMGIWQ